MKMASCSSRDRVLISCSVAPLRERSQSFLTSSFRRSSNSQVAACRLHSLSAQIITGVIGASVESTKVAIVLSIASEANPVAAINTTQPVKRTNL